MTSKARNLLIISVVVAVVAFLGLFGTYLANDQDWGAVLRILTLPQCLIAYISGAGLAVCALIHSVFRRHQ